MEAAAIYNTEILTQVDPRLSRELLEGRGMSLRRTEAI